MKQMEEKEAAFSRACIALLKGIVCRSSQEKLWQDILEQRNALKEYLSRLGLVLYLDEMDEYAYLRQSDDEEVPRLIPRYPLSYGLSMLLIILRKQLGEYDAMNGDQRLIVAKGDMVLKMQAFFPAMTNEIKFQQEVERHLRRAEEMGFLQKLSGQEDSYEVRPLLRSFVNASWLQEFSERLQDYLDYGRRQKEEAAPEEGEGLDGLV